jgi:site-specific recombinase XerD
MIEMFLGGYRAASTRAAYRCDLSLWMRHCRAVSVDPLALRRSDIEGYARTLESRGLTPATVSRRLSTLTGFYRWAADDGLVESNPAQAVAIPGGRVPPGCFRAGGRVRSLVASPRLSRRCAGRALRVGW